jgi:hypothetical protein
VGVWRRQKAVLLVCWLVALECLYSIYVGGDSWERWGGANRFVCIVMPIFFVAFASALHSLLTQLFPTGRRASPAFALLLLGSLVQFNVLTGLESLRESAGIDPSFARRDHVESATKSRILCDLSTPAAEVAVVRAGIIPYLCERPTIDLLGKNDRVIAAEPMRVDSAHKYTSFYPGHLKWNYTHSIGELKPDIVAELWGIPEEAGPYLDRDYVQVELGGFEFFLRKDSPNIQWSKLPPG